MGAVKVYQTRAEHSFPAVEREYHAQPGRRNRCLDLPGIRHPYGAAGQTGSGKKIRLTPSQGSMTFNCVLSHSSLLVSAAEIRRTAADFFFAYTAITYAARLSLLSSFDEVSGRKFVRIGSYKIKGTNAYCSWVNCVFITSWSFFMMIMGPL